MVRTAPPALRPSGAPHALSPPRTSPASIRWPPATCSAWRPPRPSCRPSAGSAGNGCAPKAGALRGSWSAAGWGSQALTHRPREGPSPIGDTWAEVVQLCRRWFLRHGQLLRAERLQKKLREMPSAAGAWSLLSNLVGFCAQISHVEVTFRVAPGLLRLAMAALAAVFKHIPS